MASLYPVVLCSVRVGVMQSGLSVCEARVAWVQILAASAPSVSRRLGRGGAFSALETATPRPGRPGFC